MIKLIACYLFILSVVASASETIDYQTNTLLRTQNIGLYTNAVVGKSHKIWENPSQKFLYGFVRAGVTGQTSLVVNSLMPQLDFYPISILGFYVGKDFTHRDFNVPHFDCINEVTCKGWMNREYVGSRMALAFKDLYFMSDYRIIKAHGQKVDKPFAEERSSLIGHPDYDYLHRFDILTGYKLNDKYSVGYLLHHNVMRRLDNSSLMQMGFVRYQMNQWNLIFGNGTFRSRDDKTFYSSLLLLQWNGSRGLLLF